MNWLSIFTTLFDVAWLIVLLSVLWRIMRSSERNSKANQIIAEALIGTSASNAQSAKQAVKVAQDAIDLLKEQLHGS